MNSNHASKTKILIAEDSRTQAEQLAFILDQGGYEVTIAVNGKLALQAAQAQRPDLIISDVMMPEMNGYELSKAIKTDEKLKDIPLILVTTLTDSQDVIRGLECGADNFIRKPYNERYLLSRIEYLLMNLSLRREHKLQLGVEIDLGGRKHFINAERQQVLDLLISTYEQAILINDELKLREKDLTHSNRILQGLFDISEGLNRVVSEREVAEMVLVQALKFPGIRAGWISIYENSGFRLLAARNLPPALATPGALDGECECRRKLLNGKLDGVANIFKCERLANAKGDTQGLCCHTSVPFAIDGGRTPGILNLTGEGEGLFNEDDLKVLHNVGQQLAVSLERARLHEHLEQLVEERTAELRAEVAERKRIQEDQARLAAIIDATPDFVATGMPNGHLLYMNRAGKHMLGYEPEQDVSELLLGAVHPDWALKLVLETGIPHAIEHGAWSGEIALLRADGKEIPVSQVIIAHKKADGSLAYLSTVARDVTQRKENEARIRWLNRIYAVLSGINTAIVHVREETELFGEACRIAVENGGFVFAWIGKFDADTQQVTPVARAGHDDGYLAQINLTDEEDASEHCQLTAQALTQAKPAICNDIASDGRMAAWRNEALNRGYRSVTVFPLVVGGVTAGVFALYAAEPDAFDDEELRLLVEMSGDISYALDKFHLEAQRKQAEKLLRNSEDNLNRAQAVGQIGSWHLDIASNRLMWSAEAHRIFGIPGQEAADLDTFVSTLHPDDREMVLKAWGEAVAGAPYDIEHRIVANGETRWVRERAIVERDAEGRALFGLGTTQDITEIKLMQMELHQLNVELENKVETRTAALERARLEAEQANRAKSSFLATMSHEIRTPLTGMLGMLELLSMTKLDKEQHATLDAAWDSGRGLLRIVSDILDWSKIEEGKLELSPRPTSIQDLLQDVFNTYSRVASVKSLVLWQHTDARLNAVYIVDPLRLSQVLNNFVSNAIKFTQQGEIGLRAELVKHLDSSDQVRFSVKDTGMGLAPEVQEHLFQRYQQESADTARMYGGTGLGLSICKRLAEMLDGEITLQSTPGKGSIFSLTLTLPISGAPGEAVSSSHMEVQQRKVVPLFDGATGAPLVLAVDDHPINRDLLARQIQMMGLRAETAENGLVALSKWREGRFALVITDCHMPEMDGYELARAIRKAEAGESISRTPVIAWTANALAEEEKHCEDAGMDALLVKPASLSQLRPVLAKWLSLAEGDGSGMPSAPITVDSEKPLDHSILDAIVTDSSEQARVLNDFITHIRNDHAKLAEMLGQGALAEVESTAHRMKGSCRMVGATVMARACEALEHAARERDAKIASVAKVALDQALERLASFISEGEVTEGKS